MKRYYNKRMMTLNVITYQASANTKQNKKNFLTM